MLPQPSGRAAHEAFNACGRPHEAAGEPWSRESHPAEMTSSLFRSHSRRFVGGPAVWALLVITILAAPAWAADVDDVFGNVGTADVGGAELEPGLAPDEGTVVGQVIDQETGLGVRGTSVILIWPKPADGSPPNQVVQLTNSAGDFRFPRVR